MLTMILILGAFTALACIGGIGAILWVEFGGKA